MPELYKIIVGCIYRHPTCNLAAFTSEFETLLKEISQYEIYILGDFNIDFLKYSEYLLTEEYLNMLYSNNLLPLITKPTRLTHQTSTLDYHIYTNSNLNVNAGISLVDISDHLPVLVCLIDKCQGIREHSIFVIIATLMWTSILEMLMRLIGSMCATNLMISMRKLLIA